LKDEYEQLAQMTVDERIIHYGFNPDRADVIVPALEIYIRIMKLVSIKQILVPKIGLADGLVKETYAKYKTSEDANQLKLPL
jgi:exopolyphosphatase/guanosine-5'-triphosphate,3'-diphosphate pyrophosphatase